MKKSITLVSISLFITFFLFGQQYEGKKTTYQSQLHQLILNASNDNTDPGEELNLLRKLDQIQNDKPFLKSGIEIKQTLDSTISMDAEGTNSFKQAFTYDWYGNNTSYKTFFWNTETDLWDDYWDENYTYDGNGNLTQLISQYWHSGNNDWKPSDRLDYSYNNEGKLSLLMDFIWRQEENDWEDQFKTEFSYDLEGKLDQTLGSRYQLNAWEMSEKTVYAYNEEGYLVQTIMESWINGSWLDPRPTNYMYDNNWNLTDMIYLVLGDDGEYHNYLKTSYTYDDANNMTSHVEYVWSYQDSAWLEGSKSEYVYDEMGNLITSYWTMGGPNSKHKFDIYYNNDYGYDDLILPNIWMENAMLFNHMPTYADNYTWDETSEHWVDSGMETYHFSEITITDIILNNSIEVKIFPNPASDFITLELADNATESLVEIYDLRGRLILSQPASRKTQLDVSHLDKGMYIFRITQNGISNSVKIMIE